MTLIIIGLTMVVIGVGMMILGGRLFDGKEKP